VGSLTSGRPAFCLGHGGSVLVISLKLLAILPNSMEGGYDNREIAKEDF
jgi:hypothetical protein